MARINPISKFQAIVFIAIFTRIAIDTDRSGSTAILAVKNRGFDVASSPLARSMRQGAQIQPAISTLVNGNYQLCTEPPPNDWRTGAGVCFNFTKTGSRASGYYGYPHSDDFICVRGKVKGNILTGEALMVSWMGREWSSIPKTAIKWDKEGHLIIKDGKIIRTSTDASGRTDWILFRSAKLDTGGFYRYNKLPLTSISQLCKWN